MRIDIGRIGTSFYSSPDSGVGRVRLSRCWIFGNGLKSDCCKDDDVLLMRFLLCLIATAFCLLGRSDDAAAQGNLPTFPQGFSPERSPQDNGIDDSDSLIGLNPSSPKFTLPITLATEWHGAVDGVRYSTHDIGLKIPAFFLNTETLPILSVGFNSTNLQTPALFDLPSNLYELSFGGFWMKPIDSEWSMIVMLNARIASDGENLSGEALRLGGGLFGVYRPDEEWTWKLGVIALGRNDLPLLPAVGVTYQPSDDWIIDLTMPNPKVSKLLFDDGIRQHWLHAGLGLSGRTWGIEQTGGVNDQLTYGDWRATIGWESTPFRPRGVSYVPGRIFSIEGGYVFSRRLELNDANEQFDLSDTAMIRVGWRF